MSRSMIFGYSVVQDEGKLIITVEGEMAGAVMTSLSHRMARANLPAFSLPPLGSPSMGVSSLFCANKPDIVEGTNVTDGLGLAEVFGQGFDRTYSEYETRLRAYSDILAAQSEDGPRTETDGSASTADRRGEAQGDAAP